MSSVETGETKQVTDGLADSVWPVWDAGGKYLWFLASTDVGLRSQWLDMTSYDHQVTFGLYLAVLKKGEASPLLPESDEDSGVTTTPETPARGPKPPVNVTIDFDGLTQRILAVTAVPVRQYTQLHAGLAGTVYFLEMSPQGGRAGGAGAAPPSGTLQRFRLSE